MEVRLKDHLCFRLYVATRLMNQAYGDALTPLGITYPKYLVLLALLEKDAQTVNSIGSLLSLDSGTLSPLLKSLASQHYVERTRLSQDERTVVNTITPAGRTICRKAKKVAISLFEQTQLSQLSLTQLRGDMDDYISRCKKILEKRNKPLKKESLWKTKQTTKQPLGKPSRANSSLAQSY